MAQRRMFSKSITNSSSFLMMSPTAQLLYIHFGMNADDDGFCEHFAIMRMTESKPDDLRALVGRGFVELFDDRVLVITDWKENNYIQKDRYTPSKYLETYKKELLELAEKRKCIQNVYKMDTQVRLELGQDTNIATQKESQKEVKKESPISESEPPPVPPPPSPIRRVVDHYMAEADFLPSQRNALYPRHVRAAKTLLKSVDGDVETALAAISACKRWAKSKRLDWSLDAVSNNLHKLME